MTETYPFFRETDEQTVAVIGEDAIAADLNGTYQKPYAVLTQKRLYCKNERGNFITDAAALRSAGKGLLPGRNWFLWAMAGCAALALALLCLWYWVLNGQEYMGGIDYWAQEYIDRYDAAERGVPDFEQTIRDYEAAQQEIEQLERQLEGADSAQLWQEVDALYREWDRRSADLNQAQREKNDKNTLVSNAKRRVSEYSKGLKDAERELANAERELANVDPGILSQVDSIREEMSYWKEWRDAKESDFSSFFVGYRSDGHTMNNPFWQFDGQEFDSINQIRTYCDNKMNEVQNQIFMIWPDYYNIYSLEYSVDWFQRMYYQAEAELEEYQQQLDAAQAAVDAAQKGFDDAYEAVNAAEDRARAAGRLEANIEQKQRDLSGKTFAYSNAQYMLQWLEDSESTYQDARSAQRTAGLFLPCFGVFAVCVLAVLILTVLKWTKVAVIAAAAAACAGLVCAFLATLPAGDWMYEYYGSMESPMVIVLRVLPVLSVLLGLAALVWNRKRTVFQVVHATGAFSFVPGRYPAGELNTFAEQVKLMREGAANGQ